jgi:tubulin-specific chaperone A
LHRQNTLYITKRLIKESKYYEQEVIQNERKLQQMKDENNDPHDIKKFQEVLSESHMMIPDSVCRKDRALDDLKEFLSTVEGELEESEWLVEAKKLLCEAGLGGEKAESGDVVETSVDGLADGEAF